MGDEIKRGGQTIHHDEWGTEYVLDENGNHQVPMQSQRTSKDGEFTTYDDSRGHCGLCGSLTCRGNCFK
jgi:hypothetical protein